jgi:hypothetical protein
MQPSEMQKNIRFNYKLCYQKPVLQSGLKLRISVVMNFSQRSGELVRLLPDLVWMILLFLIFYYLWISCKITVYEK